VTRRTRHAPQVTLQYCLWDQWKAVGGTEPRRLTCLAALVAHLLASCSLPLSILKPVRGSAAGRRAAAPWGVAMHARLCDTAHPH
jgi:hypothetical protein